MKKFTNAERVTLTTIEEVQNLLWGFTVFACFCWGLRRRRILAICFMMAVGSELLWNQTKIASKCPDTNLQRPLQCYNWKNRKSTQQNSWASWWWLCGSIGAFELWCWRRMRQIRWLMVKRKGFGGERWGGEKRFSVVKRRWRRLGFESEGLRWKRGFDGDEEKVDLDGWAGLVAIETARVFVWGFWGIWRSGGQGFVDGGGRRRIGEWTMVGVMRWMGFGWRWRRFSGFCECEVEWFCVEEVWAMKGFRVSVMRVECIRRERTRETNSGWERRDLWV